MTENPGKHFGIFYKEYTGEFSADEDCWRAYRNADKLLRVHLHVIEKTRGHPERIDLE